MIRLSYDLHIHSCLSPCGDEHMTPANIAGMAFVKGLDAIALTDHNSCKNCLPFIKHCKDFGILAIPGMEITTVEEVHVLCLFEDIKNALEFDKFVYANLIKTVNREEVFGPQIICNEKDSPVDKEKYLLINATSISYENLYDIVQRYDGLMIPAHIDKEVNSLIANLGFVREENKFTSYELNNKDTKEMMEKQNPYLKNCTMICNSDAHFLGQINEAINYIEVEERTITSVMKALR